MVNWLEILPLRFLMKRQNKSIAFTSLFAQLSTPSSCFVAPLLPWVLGGWLALTLPGDMLMAQQVVERLPPRTPVNVARKKSSSSSFTPSELDFQAPSPRRSIANFESYLVYVNETSSLRLQQVQQLEPTAFVRQYKGRFVIQAGVFKEKYNAQERLRELKSKGIQARLVSLATGKETDIVDNSKSYFVVIPGNREDLPLIEDKVRQLRKDVPVNVSQRNEPRGTHVRVGPFRQRGQAESWNRYLRNFGMKNARVYYGR